MVAQGESHALLLALIAAGLLLLRALAAAFEAATVVVGLPRAQALAAEPGAGRRARALEMLITDPESTSAAARILVTAVTLAAGALAAAAGYETFPSLGVGGSMVVALVLASAVSLILASAGRSLGARHGEAIALALAPAVYVLRPVLAPVGRLLAVLAVPFTGRAGRFSLPRPPLNEMERALAEYAKSAGGAAGQSTSELIHAIFEFREKVARDVMVPRTDVVAVEESTPMPEIIRLLAEEGHSRMPVYRETLEQIVGTLHARDLVPLLAHPELIVLRDLLRPAHFVPWSKPVDALLREMQKRKLHMAIVVDEYGGVMGICTLEDVLEEIVGEIRDEFEEEEGRAIEAHADGTFTLRGTTAIAEFNRAASAGIPEDQGYETVGGFLNALAGAIPAAGDRFFYGGWLFTISEATPRQVTRVRAARVKRSAAS